jgi:hypothetical protein
MARPCSVCKHPQRQDIDQAIINSESVEILSKRYSVTVSSLYRHKDNHLFKALQDSKRAQDLVRSDSIIDRIEDLIRRTEDICSRCERKGDDKTTIKAVHEISRNLELLAKLQGELQTHASFNVFINPQWQELRTIIVKSLDDYPDARDQVVNHLARLEVPGHE